MTKPTAPKSLHHRWRDLYVKMVQSGVDPYEAADAMLTVSGLMLEKLRGPAGAELSLRAGADFMLRRTADSKPPDGALH